MYSSSLSRCGSVVLDFMMSFNQSVVVSHVLTFLSDVARQGKFGVFKIDPSSIKQVLISQIMMAGKAQHVVKSKNKLF